MKSIDPDSTNNKIIEHVVACSHYERIEQVDGTTVMAFINNSPAIEFILDGNATTTRSFSDMYVENMAGKTIARVHYDQTLARNE